MSGLATTRQNVSSGQTRVDVTERLRATIVPQHRTSQTLGIAEAIDLKSTLLA
jgi:hypothetical protein